jgi:CheY-like chemotaxis protein
MGDLPTLAGIWVMLVDDDEETREVLTTFFSRSGAQVITAASAAEGLALFDKQRPDAIIADIGMPGEDGYTFIRTCGAGRRSNSSRWPSY